MKKCAVFSCKGLGDGLIALVLSNNLQVNGAVVTTFHPFLQGMQRWFPHLSIRSFPTIDELMQFDAFFFIYEQSPWMKPLLAHCEKHYPQQTVILNPIATCNKDYPYWEMGKFEGRRTFVDNILSFCRESLYLKLLTKSNGICVPDESPPERHKKRVILHPMSSRPGKDWPREKFIALAGALAAHGYEPIFILSQEERKGWDLSTVSAPFFENLEQLASFVSASGYMIGNDSGIGHLASCLGLPTVTICRSYHTAQFWRPSWARGKVIAPYGWIPNIKGMRLRDEHWKKWVSVKRVLKSFLHLEKTF
jgi:heptosyltransferase III